MLDDIDRECCQAIAGAMIKNLPDSANVVDVIKQDPGMTYLIEFEAHHLLGKPKVTVTIEYGDAGFHDE